MDRTWKEEKRRSAQRRERLQGSSAWEEVESEEDSDSDSEAEIESSFSDSLGQGRRGVYDALDQCYTEVLPHASRLIHLVPSEGAKPPKDDLFLDSFPTPPLEQLPRMIPSDQEMVEELSLPSHLTMEERWNSLNYPGKPDFVATKIATQGLELQFLPNMAHPPLFPWKKSKVPKSLQSFPKEIEALSPIVSNWIVEDIVTINYAEIPSEVHVSRLFGVPKDEIDVRPIIDLSFLNKFIKTPRFKMEHLDRTLRLLQHPAWAGIVDVQDAFLSVWIAPVFRKYFCFFLNGIMHMFKRMPFGLNSSLDFL